jgi:uncharacterized membrane protein
MNSLLNGIKNCDSHHRLFISTAVAVLVAFLTGGRLRLPVQMVVIWDAFLLGVLTLSWARIVTAHPRESLKTARLQDSSQTAIFLFVILAACASLVAVGALLHSAQGRQGERLIAPILLAFGTLIGSWSLIHTLFALRYAHIYYGDNGNPAAPGERLGGLQFPGERAPDYLDFAYFSFVIGMTCQVSDVQIAGRRLRRLALVHGLLAFAFNTVILALSLNIASGLFAR